eukprot:m.171155 g.171155  ORF g.171155 m.171155 type:complete len:422 (-) comp31636_c0_seq1:306-1571(-)
MQGTIKEGVVPGTPSKTKYKNVPATPSKLRKRVSSEGQRNQFFILLIGIAGSVAVFWLFVDQGTPPKTIPLSHESDRIKSPVFGSSSAPVTEPDANLFEWTNFRDPNYTVTHNGKPFQPWQTSGLSPLKLRNAAPERLVAIGDIHGDVNALIRALKVAGAVDDKLNWIGGQLVVIQSGDNLDRGDDELSVLVLLQRLRLEAAAAGGALYVLLGNHEVMNLALDFRFVAENGFTDFRLFKTDASETNARSWAELYPYMYGRAVAFQPGGTISSSALAQRQVAMVFGDTIFVHAGLHPDYNSDEALNRINQVARDFALGKLALFDVMDVLEDPDGPLWIRRYSQDTTTEICDELRATLAKLGLVRLVVGHTPQPHGISPACDGAIYRIDTGMSASFDGLTDRQIQLLEITPTSIKVIKEPDQL